MQLAEAGGGPGSSGAKGGGKGGGKGGVKPKALHPSFPNKEYQKKGFKSKYSAIGNARGRKGGQLPKGSVIKGKIDFSKYSEYEGANNGGGGRGRQNSNIIANGEVQVVEALEALVATVEQKEVLVEAAVQDGMILPPQP